MCQVTLCVNPAHLDDVTPRENLLRGQTLAAANVRKTHCTNGHEFTEENTMWRADGSRRCRSCVKIQNSAAYRAGER
jgi:hypothetical protein